MLRLRIDRPVDQIDRSMAFTDTLTLEIEANNEISRLCSFLLSTITILNINKIQYTKNTVCFCSSDFFHL